MAETFEPISSITLGADASSMAFTNIPQTYTDLFISAMWSTTAINGSTLNVSINSTSTTCSFTRILADGSAVSSARETGLSSLKLAYSNSENTFSDCQINLMSYSATNMFKHALVSWGSDSATRFPNMGKNVQLSATLSAISSLSFSSPPGNLKAGTTISLYGIKAAI